MKRGLVKWNCLFLFGVTLGQTGCIHLAQEFTKTQLNNFGEWQASIQSKRAEAQQQAAQSNFRSQTDASLTLARLHEQQGDWAQARDLYLAVHEHQPENVVACHRLGVVSARLGDHGAAVRYLMQALDANPHDSEVLTDLGYASYLQNDVQAAELSLRQALVENPANQRAVVNLALVLGQEGRVDESNALFRRAVNGESSPNLAQVHTAQGEGKTVIDRSKTELASASKQKASPQAEVHLAPVPQAAPVARTKPQLADNSPATIAMAANEETEPGRFALRAAPKPASVQESPAPAVVVAEAEVEPGHVALKSAPKLTSIQKTPAPNVVAVKAEPESGHVTVKAAPPASIEESPTPAVVMAKAEPEPGHVVVASAPEVLSIQKPPAPEVVAASTAPEPGRIALKAAPKPVSIENAPGPAVVIIEAQSESGYFSFKVTTRPAEKTTRSVKPIESTESIEVAAGVQEELSGRTSVTPATSWTDQAEVPSSTVLDAAPAGRATLSEKPAKVKL